MLLINGKPSTITAYLHIKGNWSKIFLSSFVYKAEGGKGSLGS